MRLSKLSYSENKNVDSNNDWEVKGLVFSEGFNLIVGENSAGKSRIVNIINNFAKMISSELRVMDGNWEIEFSEGKDLLEYDVEIAEGKVIKEIIKLNGSEKLDRSDGKTKIIVEGKSKASSSKIVPPEDKLVLHVRRDKKDHPFLEKIADWAKNVKGFKFGETRGFDVALPNDSGQLTSLNSAVWILDSLKTKSKETVDDIVADFNSLGYAVEAASAESIKTAPPTIVDLKVITLKEEGIKYPISQFQLSFGMFRAFSLIVLLHDALGANVDTTFIIDDIGEGLDFRRVSMLIDLIKTKSKGRNVQFIMTSNNSFLIDAVDIEDWNLIKRDGTRVTAYNYSNHKEKFDQFKETGLSNFDLFSSDFLD